MKKSIFYLSTFVLMTLVLLFNSCSEKEEDTITSNELIIQPSKLGNAEFLGAKLKKTMDIIPMESFKNLKSTNTPSFNTMEFYSPATTLYAITYYVNTNSKLEYEYEFYADGTFKGGYQHLYYANDNLSASGNFDRNCQLEFYLTYYYNTNNKIEYVAKWNPSGTLLEYNNYIYTNNEISSIERYQANGSHSTLVYFYYDNNRLYQLAFPSGSAVRTFYYTAGELYKLIQSALGHDTKELYYRFSSYYSIKHYNDNIYSSKIDYLITSGQKSNYDPLEPTNIFNLTFFF